MSLHSVQLIGMVPSIEGQLMIPTCCWSYSCFPPLMPYSLYLLNIRYHIPCLWCRNWSCLRNIASISPWQSLHWSQIKKTISSVIDMTSDEGIHNNISLTATKCNRKSLNVRTTLCSSTSTMTMKTTSQHAIKLQVRLVYTFSSRTAIVRRSLLEIWDNVLSYIILLVSPKAESIIRCTPLPEIRVLRCFQRSSLSH